MILRAALVISWALLIGAGPRGSAVNAAEAWTSCLYNNNPIPCRRSFLCSDAPCDRFTVEWKDGVHDTYTRVGDGAARNVGFYADPRGGKWMLRGFAGSFGLVNQANGNTIIVGMTLDDCRNNAALADLCSPRTTCPEGVIDQLNGLYRWRVQQMDRHEDRATALPSQRQRFTPSLFGLLLEAMELTSADDGRFIDFDIFSNTQVETFGAGVISCRQNDRSSIDAEVKVHVGLSGRSSGNTRRLLYEMKQDNANNWRVNEITYLDQSGFALRPFLEELLQPSSQAD